MKASGKPSRTLKCTQAGHKRGKFRRTVAMDIFIKKRESDATLRRWESESSLHESLQGRIVDLY